MRVFSGHWNRCMGWGGLHLSERGICLSTFSRLCFIFQSSNRVPLRRTWSKQRWIYSALKLHLCQRLHWWQFVFTCCSRSISILGAIENNSVRELRYDQHTTAYYVLRRPYCSQLALGCEVKVVNIQCKDYVRLVFAWGTVPRAHIKVCSEPRLIRKSFPQNRVPDHFWLSSVEHSSFLSWNTSVPR